MLHGERLVCLGRSGRRPEGRALLVLRVSDLHIGVGVGMGVARRVSGLQMEVGVGTGMQKTACTVGVQ